MSLRNPHRSTKVESESDSVVASSDAVVSGGETLLEKILRHSIADPSLPKDYASELDHYLYGLPKRNGPIAKSRASGKKKVAAKRGVRKPKGR